MAVCSPLHARIDRRLVDDRVDGECVPGLVVSLWPRCQLDLFGDLAAEGWNGLLRAAKPPIPAA
jgi:hypothetical protein